MAQIIKPVMWGDGRDRDRDRWRDRDRGHDWDRWRDWDRGRDRCWDWCW